MEHIRNALRRLRRSFAKSTLRKTGVQSARVSFPDKQTFLEYDSSAISSYQIKDSVEKAGFELLLIKIIVKTRCFMTVSVKARLLALG